MRPAVMRHDLRQIELGRHALGHQEAHLRRRIGMRIRPSAERQIGSVLPDVLAQLPRMLDAARRADVLVAAKHHERLESMLVGAIGIAQAPLQRMFRRQKRRDARTRDIPTEIAHQMAEIVFLLRADGAVGEEDECVVACEVLDRVIGIDPRVHACRGRKLGPRRTKLRRNDVSRTQALNQSRHQHRFS